MATVRRLQPSPSHKGVEEEAQEITSRTSLTICESWDTEPQNAVGVDIPQFLAPLLGVDFLPFSPTIQEEDEIVVPPIPPVVCSDLPPAVEKVSVKSCEQVLSPTPKTLTTEDTQELQELLIQSKKKKKAGTRFKAAARAVLQRVKSGKKAGKKHGTNLQVETDSLGPGRISNTWISPTETADGTISPVSIFTETGEAAEASEDDGLCEHLRAKAEDQEKRISTTHSEIEDLQAKLSAAIEKYTAGLAALQTTQAQLAELASTAAVEQPGKIGSKEEQRRVFKRSESGTFMRVHDLDFSRSSLASDGSDCASVSTISQSAHGPQKTNQELQEAKPNSEFLLMDHYLLEIVKQLMDLGFDLATDETDRFSWQPTRDTVKLLAQMPETVKALQNGWPVDPWTPAWGNHVLVWTGRVNHEGFGHTWPVVKGRTILHTSAQHVLEYLWDSTLVPKYNSMCQGRQDLYTLQDDVHMAEDESPYGFAGCAKIVRSLNKHRLLPKAIEMKILLYARPLQQHEGSYILVSRSVWENDNASLDSKHAKTVIRTEMLMGCTIMRAIDENTCELTNLTHVHSPGVPELLAKKASPGQCHGLMKTLQSLFPPPK